MALMHDVRPLPLDDAIILTTQAYVIVRPWPRNSEKRNYREVKCLLEQLKHRRYHGKSSSFAKVFF